MSSTAVVERENPIVQLFRSAEAQKYIRAFLPEGADPERVIASVLIAVNMDKTGMLAKCTPQSLVLGVARIQQWGLELGTTAHLLPFKNKVEKDGRETFVFEATACADYKGLAELMVASGAVRNIEARCVYEGDFFDYEYGTNAHIKHVPKALRDKSAKITHAYCILDLPFSRHAFEVMAAADIDAIRQQYSKQWKTGPLQPWYAKKTVVRQVAKLVPKNPRLAQALLTMQQDRDIEGIDPSPNAPAVARIAPAEDEDTPTVNVDALEEEREPGQEG